MFEAFKCYSSAFELLLKNIKAYGCFVMINIAFFSLVLFVPLTVFFLPVKFTYDDLMLILAIFISSVFTLTNFPMLVISQNIVDLGEKNESFKIKQIFKSNLPWTQILGIGIGINFIIFSFALAVFAVIRLSSGINGAVTFSTFFLFLELFLTICCYIYINKANRIGKLGSVTSVFALFGKYAKICYSFLGLYILISLVNCILVYFYVSGMHALVTFFVRNTAYEDLQLSFIHAGFSTVLLILFNTVNLAAKGQLFRKLEELENK